MERRFKVGDRVKVVKAPPYEPDYQEIVGKCGVVEGGLWDDKGDDVRWCYVVMDGERVGMEFKADELERVNPIHEVVGVAQWVAQHSDLQVFMIGDVRPFDVLTQYLGKHIRLTVEELAD